MKIVINTCWGGFGLSALAIEEYCKAKGIDPGKRELWEHCNWATYTEFDPSKIERNDPVLVEIVERLGQDSWGFSSELKVVTIPDDVDWVLGEYDGIEHVAERHRTWS